MLIGIFFGKFFWFFELFNCFGGWNFCILFKGKKENRKGSWWEFGREWRMSFKGAELLIRFLILVFDLFCFDK